MEDSQPSMIEYDRNWAFASWIVAVKSAFVCRVLTLCLPSTKSENLCVHLFQNVSFVSKELGSEEIWNEDKMLWKAV